MEWYAFWHIRAEYNCKQKESRIALGNPSLLLSGNWFIPLLGSPYSLDSFTWFPENVIRITLRHREHLISMLPLVPDIRSNSRWWQYWQYIAVDFIRISLLPCNIEHMFLYRIAKNYRFVKTDIKNINPRQTLPGFVFSHLRSHLQYRQDLP